MHPIKCVLPAAVAVGCLALPLGAQAAVTKTVYMGPPPKTLKAQQQGFDVNAFFPGQVTIHAGDKVRFVAAGFHTADIPKKGGSPTPLVTPQGTVTGSNDAAANPFWFNNLVKNIGFTPSLVTSSLYGKTATYTGKTAVDTGLPLGDNPKPAVITFTKPGSYTFHCDVHPGMMGKVNVAARTKKLVSAKGEKARLKAQLAKVTKDFAKIDTKTAPANTVHVGVAGKDGTEFFGFVPSTLSVPVGTTVRFDMSPGSREIHTATTGPGNPMTEPTSYLGTLQSSMEKPTFDPAIVYPSDSPLAGPASLTPQSHGNGYWNSGFMDASAATAQVPGFNTVTFAAPGTYEFYCMIHPFMHGTVTVG